MSFASHVSLISLVGTYTATSCPVLIPSHAVLGTTIAPTEQFDEGLDRKLLALQREQVEWSSVIAERRRKAPGQAKDLEDMLENIKESLEWDVDMDETEAEGEGKEKEDAEEMMLDPEREWSEQLRIEHDAETRLLFFSRFRVDRTPA